MNTDHVTFELVEPTQYCDRCGIGPFFRVPARRTPDLCADCSEEAARVGLLCLSISSGATVWYPPAAK